MKCSIYLQQKYGTCSKKCKIVYLSAKRPRFTHGKHHLSGWKGGSVSKPIQAFASHMRLLIRVGNWCQFYDDFCAVNFSTRKSAEAPSISHKASVSPTGLQWIFFKWYCFFAHNKLAELKPITQKWEAPWPQSSKGFKLVHNLMHMSRHTDFNHTVHVHEVRHTFEWFAGLGPMPITSLLSYHIPLIFSFQTNPFLVKTIILLHWQSTYAIKEDDVLLVVPFL